MGDFAEYYRQIYARGLGGEAPAIPMALCGLARLEEIGPGLFAT